MNPGLTFSLETLGCKLNYAEGSSIARTMEDSGYGNVLLSDSPDIFIINTCSVTENANKKCRSLIRRARRENPSVFIAVVGCYAQLEPEAIAGMEGVNLVLGAAQKHRLPEYILEGTGAETGLKIAGPIKEVRDFVPAHSYGDRVRSFMKVQDGCDYFCSFCTIPMARGLSRSPSIESCVERARSIARQGVKEIVLTGVNIGDFGRGSRETFLDLIKKLDEINGIERFRISSIEPDLLSDAIIEFVADSRRFMPHFHIPLQSGSDNILSRMKRKYRVRDYRNTVEMINRTIPDAAIGVDVITGFPGETESDFEESRSLITSLNVSYLHVFPYSERPNTRAARYSDQVPVEIRRNRSGLLQKLSEVKKRQFYGRFLGNTLPVLLEHCDGGKLEGYSPNYLRIRIDGSGELENSLINAELLSIGPDHVFSGIALGEEMLELRH